MALTGMDIQAVRNMGNELQRQKGEIEQVVRQIEQAIGNATWMGPDADRFRNDWWPPKRTALANMANDLHGFGQSALNQAQEQEDVANR